MQWEQLTSTEFRQAVEQTKVCVVAFGVVEKHGEHLPLGTDFLNGHKICTLAAQEEPAVVFPPFYFGQIYEAKCFPGTITLKPTLLLQIVQEILNEIGRNGFKKIILYNAHGGNTHFLNFIAQCSLAEQTPYSIYCHQRKLPKNKQAEWQNICDTTIHEHACECETSISLANHSDLVKMDKVLPEPALPLERSKNLKGNFSGITWYSNYPEHYAGDARTATKEKGEALRAIAVEQLVNFIKKVKADTVIPDLENEFFARAKSLGGK